MRFRLKTHTFFIRFRLPSTLIRSITEVYVCENGGFRKRSLEWRFLKTEVQRLCVDGRKRRFRKRLRHWHCHVPVKKNKTDVFLCVFGGQVWTVENTAKTLVWTKNFLSVFKKQKTEVFENPLVWTGPDSQSYEFYPMRGQLSRFPRKATRLWCIDHQTKWQNIFYYHKIRNCMRNSRPINC